MSKGLAILNGYSHLEGPVHFYERMKEELAVLNVGLSACKTTDFLSLIKEDGSIDILPGLFSFILFLDKDAYLSKALEKQRYRLFNTAEAIRLSDDKMLTYLQLSNHGISMPTTIGAPLNYSGGFSSSFLDHVERKLSYPLIAKGSYGSMGREVSLVSSRIELEIYEKEHAKTPHLYQKYIESSKGVDYRIIVVGGHVVTGMKRENHDDWRSNIAQGGVGIKCEIPDGYSYVAEKAASLMGLDYAGVDILIGKNGEPILCEVNSNAFLDGIEKTTEVNVAASYARHIVKTLGL